MRRLKLYENSCMGPAVGTGQCEYFPRLSFLSVNCRFLEQRPTEAVNSAARRHSKGEHMKPNIKTAIATTILAGAIVLNVVSNAYAQPPKACSNATLRGDYGAT